MPVAQDIADLGRRAKRELIELSDFCFHTDETWQLIKTWVAAGNSPSLNNVHTGSVATGVDLVALTDRYHIRYVLPFSFQHLTAIFERFLFDLLRLILLNNPVQLSQDRQLRVRDLLPLRDRAEMLDLLVEQELLSQAYRRPRDWFDYLNRLVHTGCPTAAEIEAFAEIKACRDVLAHNAGVVNETYVEKAGPLARFQLGELVVIEPPYFMNCWRLVDKLVGDLAGGVVGRLAPP